MPRDQADRAFSAVANHQPRNLSDGQPQPLGGLTWLHLVSPYNLIAHNVYYGKLKYKG